MEWNLWDLYRPMQPMHYDLDSYSPMQAIYDDMQCLDDQGNDVGCDMIEEDGLWDTVDQQVVSNMLDRGTLLYRVYGF